MEQGLVTIIQVVIGSGFGAGVVTFLLNFLKAERDFRRAKLEELYTSVHKYTLSGSLMSVRVRMDQFDPSEDQTELTAQSDLINVLIDLYFPQLKPSLESFRSRNQDFVTATFRDREDLRQGYLAGGESRWREKLMYFC